MKSWPNTQYFNLTPESPSHVKYPFLITSFIIGIIAGIKIKIGGELFLGEPLAICYLLINFNRARFTIGERWFAILALVWALAQLASDAFNGTTFIDSVKGVLAPIFFAFTMLGLLIFFRDNIARMPSFLIGTVVAASINLIILPSDYFLTDNMWKWGLGGIALKLTLIYYSFFLLRKSNALLVGWLFIFLIISFYNSARGMAVFPFMAAIAYLLLTTRRLPLAEYFRGKWALVRSTAIAIPLILLGNMAASALFTSNIILENLPDDVEQKYLLQASSPYGVLLAGRSEILVSTQAFLDKPLLGHGSWAIDEGIYSLNYMQMLYLYGMSDLLPSADIYIEEMLIPAHSFLMGALVWAGLLGGLFWVYVLVMLANTIQQNLRHLPVYFYVVMVGVFWSIFFSPFGASARWSTALSVAALLAYTYRLRNTKAELRT